MAYALHTVAYKKYVTSDLQLKGEDVQKSCETWHLTLHILNYTRL